MGVALAKLGILSDLHLEALPYPESFRPDPPTFAVLMRVAGDKPIAFVMGNHEHWDGVVDETLILAHALADRAGITLLDGTSATIAGCRFVGTTLWSADRLAGHLDPDRRIHQCRTRRDGRSSRSHGGDAAALHRYARAVLGKRIAADDGALPLVVVTHHAPHPDCIHPSQRGTWNAGNWACRKRSTIEKIFSEQPITMPARRPRAVFSEVGEAA